jgi:CubicO group peptidase (beta-lactamase class C family)
MRLARLRGIDPAAGYCGKRSCSRAKLWAKLSASAGRNRSQCFKNVKNDGDAMTPQPAPLDATSPRTPSLPMTRPEALGLSPARLQRMRDALQREIDKGTTPGVVTMVARRGQIGWFEAQGRQNPASDAPMARDSLFRIFSMTKPLVSIGIAQLLEDGHLLLADPLEKFIPEFADQKVGVETNGKLELVPRTRSIMIHDLLRHTSGIAYEITGNGIVQTMYRDAKIYRRDISNAEHAALIASLPLMCQPGAEWNYSRSTDILGRVIEVVSGKSLGAYLTERILAPLRMTETAFHTAPRTNRASPSRSRRIRGPATGSCCSTQSNGRRWNPVAAASSRPRWTTPASARCCSTAAPWTARPSSAARRCSSWQRTISPRTSRWRAT